MELDVISPSMTNWRGFQRLASQRGEQSTAVLAISSAKKPRAWHDVVSGVPSSRLKNGGNIRTTFRYRSHEKSFRCVQDHGSLHRSALNVSHLGPDVAKRANRYPSSFVCFRSRSLIDSYGYRSFCWYVSRSEYRIQKCEL